MHSLSPLPLANAREIAILSLWPSLLTHRRAFERKTPHYANPKPEQRPVLSGPAFNYSHQPSAYFGAIIIGHVSQLDSQVQSVAGLLPLSSANMWSGIDRNGIRRPSVTRGSTGRAAKCSALWKGGTWGPKAHTYNYDGASSVGQQKQDNKLEHVDNNSTGEEPRSWWCANDCTSRLRLDAT